MQGRSIPLGMLRRDDILNALLAIWKSRCSTNMLNPTQFNRGYEIGFEEGLEAVAQFTGLTEEFELGKDEYVAKTRSRLEPFIIEGNATSIGP